MNLFVNILYNTIIFFTTICVANKVLFCFLGSIAAISGFLQILSYETLSPTYIVLLTIIPLEITFFVIFTFFFIYMFNISSKSIDYFKDSKWNKLIISSVIVFVLMIINYALGNYLKPMLNIMLSSYFLPISWFLLFHIYNLKYLEKVETGYSKFPFYAGIVLAIYTFKTINPFLIERISSMFN